MTISRDDWNTYMTYYDTVVRVLWPYQKMVEQVLEAMDIKDGQLVVDAGCGTGVLLQRILEMNRDNVTLVGVEQQPAAIKRVWAKLNGYGVARVEEADLNSAQWADDFRLRVDTLVSVNVLYILNDPAHFLDTVRKVLKPGGRFVLVNPWKMAWEPVLEEHNTWATEYGLEPDPAFEAALDHVIKFNTRIVEEVKRKVYHFLSPDELYRLFQDAGLNVREVDPNTYSGTAVMVIATKP